MRAIAFWCALALVGCGANRQQSEKKDNTVAVFTVGEDHKIPTINIDGQGRASVNYVDPTKWEVLRSVSIDGQLVDWVQDDRSRKWIRHHAVTLYSNAMALCPVFKEVVGNVDLGGNGVRDLILCTYDDGLERGRWMWNPPVLLEDGKLAVWSAGFVNMGRGYYDPWNEPPGDDRTRKM